jgi:hypothetical protein
MPNKPCYVTPLLAAVAAAVIATAPTAAADAAPTQPTTIATAPAAVDPTQSTCMSLGGTKTRCQTPGNVQINDSPSCALGASLETDNTWCTSGADNTAATRNSAM